MKENSHRATLVLGFGNLLLGDEGVGVHCARLLMAKSSAHVKIIDRGTAVINALADLEWASKVVVLDAVKGGGAPGSLYRIEFDGDSSVIVSMHGFDLKRVMGLCSRCDKPEVIVIGIEPELIKWSLKLSDPVQLSLPKMLAAVQQEIKD